MTRSSTAVHVPKAVHLALKRAAEERGVTIGHLTAELARFGLPQLKEPKPTKPVVLFKGKKS